MTREVAEGQTRVCRICTSLNNGVPTPHFDKMLHRPTPRVSIRDLIDRYLTRKANA